MKTLLPLLIAGLALAQQPGGVSITAEVDRQTAALNEQIILTVTVSGGRTDLPDPELPSIPNMMVYSSGRSQNISFVNGQVSSAVTYTYVLAPRFVGKATIGPIGLAVDGQRYQTAPIEIQVVRPSAGAGAAPSPTAPIERKGRAPHGGSGPDAFVTASVDKPRAFVNEQIILTVRFHTAVSLLGNPEYVPPALSGFLSEDLPPERHGQVQHKGRLYHYSEIRTALFPAQSGKLAIGSALVRAQFQAEMAVDPFAPDFFQKFFSQGLLSAQTRELRTDPIVVTAETLPEAGKPESFTGAVGRFRITGGVDKRSLKVGEALTLTVTVDGAGNLKALGAPKVPESPSFRVYDTVASLNQSKTEDAVRGSKVFRTVLVPRVSGTLTIPSIPFSYFDPSRREYVKAGTAPIDVEVAPAAPGTPGASYVAPAAPGGDLTAVQEDIRYVHESDAMPLASRALGALAAAVWLHLLPLAGFLGSLGVAGYRERLLLDPAGARARRAGAKALGLLREAEKGAETDPAKASTKLAEALTGYLADKLGRSPGGLTLREAQDALRARFPRVAPETLDRLRQAWQEIEQLRFAGGAAGGAGDAVVLASLIAQLVKELETAMAEKGRPPGLAKALLFAAALSAAAAALAADEPLRHANDLYRQGQYAQAAAEYRALVEAHPERAALHYNLADASFKIAGPRSLGKAIAGYLRAWELAPRDGDVRHNLEFCLNRAGETLVPAGTPRTLFLLFHAFSRSELLGLQWIGYWLCLLLGAAYLLAAPLRVRLKPWLLGALAFWLAFGSWWGLRTVGAADHLGVVLEPNAEARSGPGRSFPVGFNVPEGRRVVIVSESDDWLEIGTLKEGLKGWVQAQQIERVY